MTAKRFKLMSNDEVIIDNCSIADDGGKQTYWVISYGQRVKLVELLNELHEENQHLESHLEMVREQRDKQMEKSKALKKQLDREHQMLENAILIERTRMGQNSLKQYKEAIQ